MSKGSGLFCLLLLAAGCTVLGGKQEISDEAKEQRLYTATNLYAAGEKITYDGPVTGTLVPVGTEVHVVAQHGEEFTVETTAEEAKARYVIRVDPKASEPREELGRYLTAKDPRPALARLGPEARRAVQIGRAFQGMSEDEVRLALGTPARDQVSRDGARTYWFYLQKPMEARRAIVFESGRVVRVEGQPGQ